MSKKLTKCALSKKHFRQAMDNLKTALTAEGIVWNSFSIRFSDCGKEKYATEKDWSKSGIDCLTQNGTGDVFGFCEVNDGKVLYIVTGELEGQKVKAPKDLSNLFYSFYNDSVFHLKSIDVSCLDVSKSTQFRQCFQGVDSKMGIEIVGLETWDTSNAVNMAYMFYGYNESAGFVDLDLSNFDVSKVVKFDYMFAKCGRLADEFEIKGIEQWRPEKGWFFDSMFKKCGAKADYCLDLSNWDCRGEEPKDFREKVAFKIKNPKWHPEWCN